MTDTLHAAAFDDHRDPTSGETCVTSAMKMAADQSLLLGYRPPAGNVCPADSQQAGNLALRSLATVIRSGKAVLELCNIDLLESVPVIEIKDPLFGKFACFSVFDSKLTRSKPDVPHGSGRHGMDCLSGFLTRQRGEPTVNLH